MSVQLAIRGTRKMEESGETELILATATPKTVPVLAVVLELVIVNVINGVGMYLAWLSPPFGPGAPGGEKTTFSLGCGLMPLT